MGESILKTGPYYLATTACLAWVATIAPAYAQTTAPDLSAETAAAPPARTDDQNPGGLTDIVVTAERRSSSVQRTGLAIDALDASSLIASGVKDARDLALAVPSVHIASLGLYTNVYIHGVGGGVSNAYGSPAVAYSIDGVFIDNASGASSAFFDLSRVEIVKGPQGTLYGRNATAGALNLVPNRPTSELEASLSASYGNYDAVELEGMVNIPISDGLSSRIAFKSIDRQGYLSNGANDADTKALRAQLLWEVSNRVTLQAYFDYARSGGVGFQSVPLYPGVDSSTFGTGAIRPGLPAGQRLLNPDNPWETVDSSALYPTLLPFPYPSLRPLAGDDARINNKQYIGHLEANIDFGAAKLTILPAFVGIRNDSVLYESGFRAYQREHVDQYSMEVRLASNDKGPLQWILGGYYFNAKGNALADFYQIGIGDVSVKLDNYQSISKAVFAQATYSVSDRLRLTGGVRYTHEKKSETGQTILGNLFIFPAVTPATCQPPSTYYAPEAGGTVNPARCGIVNEGELTFSSTDYKFGLEFDIADRSLFYINVSSGFKAGGFNPGGPPNTYAPERLKDYDFGLKNRFFNNRLQLNFEAFYWEYKNQQAQAFGPINPGGYAYIVYPSNSHIYGAAVDAIFAISPSDKIGASLEYQVGKYDQYQTSAVPAVGVPAINGAGEDRPFTPKWSGRIDYTHSFALASGAHLDLNVNTVIRSSQYLSTTPKIPFQIGGQNGFHKSNASLTFISADERYSISGFVNNIENTFTINSVQLGSTTGNYFGYVDPPRTYGVRMSGKF